MAESVNNPPRLPQVVKPIDVLRPDREANPERERLAVELLSDLIRIPSVTNKERECEPVDRLMAFFEKHGKGYGISCRVIEAGGKRNFIAEVGDDKDGEESVLLNAHFDVVPAEDQMFNPRIENGVGYGRGMCDDKGGLVAMAMTILEMAKTKSARGKVIFCAVNDEEDLGRGTEACIENGVVAKHVIVAEPTEGQVVIGHSGRNAFKIKVEGTSVHAALAGLGRNAIVRLSAVSRKLGRMLKSSLFHDSRWPKPPAFSITTTDGGMAKNVVPGYAEATFDVRPQEDPNRVLDKVKQAISGLNGVSLDEKMLTVKPCIFNENSALVMAALAETNQLRAVCVPWRSDAVTYTHHPFSKKVLDGIIVLGPGRIEDAHTDHEQIQIADLLRTIDQYKSIIMRLQA